MLKEDSPVTAALTDILLGFSKSEYTALRDAADFIAEYPELISDRDAILRILKVCGLVDGWILYRLSGR